MIGLGGLTTCSQRECRLGVYYNPLSPTDRGRGPVQRSDVTANRSITFADVLGFSGTAAVCDLRAYQDPGSMTGNQIALGVESPDHGGVNLAYVALA